MRQLLTITLCYLLAGSHQQTSTDLRSPNGDLTMVDIDYLHYPNLKR
jgi:hypothetical protein